MPTEDILDLSIKIWYCINMRIYIDTSVINGLCTTKNKIIQDITKQFFNTGNFGNFTIYISEAVITEIKNTPNHAHREYMIKAIQKYGIEILPVPEEARVLAKNYIHHKIIPLKYMADALHIAVAVVHNIPVLVSWNFKHIVRHKTRLEVNRINKEIGYPQIDLCSPEEV